MSSSLLIIILSSSSRTKIKKSDNVYMWYLYIK